MNINMSRTGYRVTTSPVYQVGSGKFSPAVFLALREGRTMKRISLLFSRAFRAHGRHAIDYTSSAAIEAALNVAEVNHYLASLAKG